MVCTPVTETSRRIEGQAALLGGTEAGFDIGESVIVFSTA